MIEQTQRSEVGAVGAKLLYPDRRIQHTGIVLGIFGGAGHAFRKLPDNCTAYFGFADLLRNCSAVSSACMMVRRQVFEKVGGFDNALRVTYNDVDLCLRVRERGYLVVYTPFSQLYREEPATRESLESTEDDEVFFRRWGDMIRRGDPYYNPNLALNREDWSLRF
jgi:GT2 family glycosyltransferase